MLIRRLPQSSCLDQICLIAPNPYPEEPDAYTVELPSQDWFDYWTGARVPQPPAAPGTSVLAVSPAPMSIPMHPELRRSQSLSRRINPAHAAVGAEHE